MSKLQKKRPVLHLLLNKLQEVNIIKTQGNVALKQEKKGGISMRIAEKVINKIGSTIPKLDLTIGLNTTEQACIWWFRRSEVPEELANFKKPENDN